MPKIISKIDRNSEDFEKNTAAHQKLVAELRDVDEYIMQGGPERSREKHLSRGKLMVRERIRKLLDADTDFLEIGRQAAWRVYTDDVPSAGIVTGIGKIHGRECMLVANDATVKGGTYYPLTVKKHLRAQEVAAENRLPCVYLVDSGGAFLPQQDEVFPDRDDFGRIFFNQAHLSAAAIPQIAIVMGSCTAGGAYVPAMCEESIIVRNQGTIFLGGPPLVKAATGEEVDAETLGGGSVHSRISGVTDHLADDDDHAIAIARDIVANLNLPMSTYVKQHEPSEPVYAAEEIYGIVSREYRFPYDIREIIARVVDASEFHEFKRLYGATLVCGFARIDGYPVGIVANNGILFPESAQKGAHFVQLCNRRRIPLVFLQNITGFMVGKRVEHAGIAKDGAKLVNAVATATVPKFTVVVGGSFGAGNYAMCGRAYSPNMMWMWPNARISVMGGEQAAMVLSTVQSESRTLRGEEWADTDKLAFENRIRDQYETQGHPLYASARLWDDGVIEPTDTRRVLRRGLSIAMNGCAKEEAPYGIFRM